MDKILEVIAVYFNFLVNNFITDMQRYDNWWMWVFFLIPAIFYTIAMIIKYALLTMLIWIPLRLIFIRFEH